MKNNTGLIVMRGQPLHNGHISLINLMLKECNNCNIVLGSIQESGTERNPFTFEERKQMIKNIYGDKINIYGVEDIPNNNELWLKTIFSKIKNKVDIYYCGDDDNGIFFKNDIKTIRKLDRNNQKEDLKISGTEIREMIINKNIKWKNFVPKKNIKLIEDYIKKLK